MDVKVENRDVVTQWFPFLWKLELTVKLSEQDVQELLHNEGRSVLEKLKAIVEGN